MLKLIQFAPAFGLPNPSPFCFKVETYLRMAGIPYEAKVGDPRKAPKKKLPFVVDDDGKVIADSDHIVSHLEKAHGKGLDDGMSAEERATARAVRRMVEEGLYFALVHVRWVQDAGFAHTRAELLEPAIPSLLRPIVIPMIQRQIKAQVWAQGTGRHAEKEIFKMAADDIDAVATLFKGPFFFGEAPRTIDATLYAFFALVLWAPPESPVKEALKSKANLVAFCEMVKARYFAKT